MIPNCINSRTRSIPAFRRAAHLRHRLILILLLPLALSDPLSAQSHPFLQQIRLDVDTLTSPTMGGRGYADGGHVLAAEFIRDRFENLGLIPINGSYLKPFSLRADLLTSTPTIRINDSLLTPGVDFLPYRGSGDGCSVEPKNVTVLPMDSVLSLSGPDLPRGNVFLLEKPDKTNATNQSTLISLPTTDSLLYALEKKEASAVLISSSRLSFAPLEKQFELPVFHITEDHKPESDDVVSFCIETTRDTVIQSNNVAGYVAGNRQPDSLIILTAHYDHLGRLSDSIYFPGANDNAAGVALLLALAQRISQDPLAYSTLFVAFSGEERGLLGSMAFVSHPPLPLDRTSLVLNFDMIASGEEGVVVVGGSDFSALFNRLSTSNESLGNVHLGKRKNAPISDHFPFTLRGIPALYLYANHGRQPYHTIDDKAETLEWADLLHIYRLSETFLYSF